MQGFNMGRYVPPDAEGNTSGNKLHKRRAPGTLRRDGSQTVRFEMPFAVWCHTCTPHAIIGQGVRFNAEKRKMGYYHSTPIWSFCMKHPACTGTIEIQTDPKNTAYIVTAGGKARDYGEPEDRVREGENKVPVLTAEERERRREDAFAQLEGKADERAQIKDNTKRLQELYEARDRDWDDPWSANKRMRASFREERRDLKRKEQADEALKERIGMGIDLLPETEEDNKRAKLMAETARSIPQMTSNARAARCKSIRLKHGSHKAALQKQLISSTKAALDPFG